MAADSAQSPEAPPRRRANRCEQCGAHALYGWNTPGQKSRWWCSRHADPERFPTIKLVRREQPSHPQP